MRRCLPFRGHFLNGFSSGFLGRWKQGTAGLAPVEAGNGRALGLRRRRRRADPDAYRGCRAEREGEPMTSRGHHGIAST